MAARPLLGEGLGGARFELATSVSL
jgi:hypothetical protein